MFKSSCPPPPPMACKSVFCRPIGFYEFLKKKVKKKNERENRLQFYIPIEWQMRRLLYIDYCIVDLLHIRCISKQETILHRYCSRGCIFFFFLPCQNKNTNFYSLLCRFPVKWRSQRRRAAIDFKVGLYKFQLWGFYSKYCLKCDLGVLMAGWGWVLVNLFAGFAALKMGSFHFFIGKWWKFIIFYRKSNFLLYFL